MENNGFVNGKLNYMNFKLYGKQLKMGKNRSISLSSNFVVSMNTINQLSIKKC